jgi:hypothetical protein
MLYFPHLYGRYANAAQEYAVTLYLNLAELLGTRIEQGLYRPASACRRCAP